MEKPERLYDVRTLRRNLAAGIVTEDEHQSYLESLEDCAELSAPTEVRFVHRQTEDDGDDA